MRRPRQAQKNMDGMGEAARNESPPADVTMSMPPAPSPDSDRSNADDGTNLSLMVPDPPHEKKKQLREEGAPKFRWVACSRFGQGEKGCFSCKFQDSMHLAQHAIFCDYFCRVSGPGQAFCTSLSMCCLHVSGKTP